MHMEDGVLCLTRAEQEALNFACETDPKRKEFYDKIPTRVLESETPIALSNALAYARVGMIALIDEATEKQADRPRDFLATKYKEYLDG